MPVPMVRTLAVTVLSLALVVGLASCERSDGLADSGQIGPRTALADSDSDDPWAGRDDLIQAPPPAAPRPVNLPTIQRFELKNGLRVRVIQDQSLPMVLFHLAVLGGRDQEPHELRSLSDYTAQMLTKGTRSRSADDISQTIDFVGGKLKSRADLDGTQVICLVLSKDWDTCLDLVPDVVIHPTFPKAEMGTVRDRLITMVKQVRDLDGRLADEHFDNLLWGENHSRGWPVTVGSVNAISRKDLVAWHAARFKPNNALLYVAGAVDPEELRRKLDETFGDWPRGEVVARKTYPQPKLTGFSIRLVDKPAQTQTQIKLGHLGLAHADQDYLAVSLVNYTLGGGGFSSRLMKKVRSEGGKTYQARTRFESERLRGEFWAYTFTRNAEAVTTLKMLLAEIELMRKSGPSAQELADAQTHMAGKYPMYFETAKGVVGKLLRHELHGLGEDYVREYPLRVSGVTLEQARRAAAEHLTTKDLMVVLVGNAAELEPQLKEAGFEYEKIGYLEPTSATEREAKRALSDAPTDPKLSARGRELLDRALRAKGGEAKLRAIEDIYIEGKGKLTSKGQNFDAKVKSWFAVPQRERVEIQIPLGTIFNVVTPEAAWGGLGAMVRDAPADISAEDLAGFWRHKDLILLRHLDSKGVYIQARESIEQDGKRYDVVELRKEDGSLATRIWLNAKSHLLARLEYERRGEKVSEQYDDYRAVKGLQMAFSQKQTGGDTEVDLKFSLVRINAGIPAGTFDRPADAVPPPTP
jgi:zinc protease